MAFPCPDKILCPDDQALANLTTEAYDAEQFAAVNRNLFQPPLGSNWTSNFCYGSCVSYISQEDADQCAARLAEICSGKVFYNEARSGTVSCPDGTPFTYTVQAGLFMGYTQAEANAIADSYAAQLAATHRICLGDCTCQLCVGVPATIDFTCTGAPLPLQSNTWQVISGSVPDGMSFGFTDDTPQLSGIPLTADTYTFTLRVTASNGDFAQRTYTIHVLEIADDTALPAFAVGTPYSHQLTVVGGSGSYIFTLEAGALPTGIFLDTDGLIHGTPTTTDTASFTIGVTDLCL